jgi:hypothetical protein
MRLRVRSDQAKGGSAHEVIDSDTGKKVGFLRTGQLGARVSWGEDTPQFNPIPSRAISLFDGKFSGEFESHDECVAFAKGVEAVLNQILPGGSQEAYSQKPVSKAAA